VNSRFIKEYFNFSKRERNGLIVLFTILAIIIISRLIILNISTSNSKNFQNFENEIDVFISYRTPNLENGERFNFDPNTATREDFMRMGLCNKTINSIITFREKGWKFYKPEDLEKVYEITPEEYEAIKDYIIIESDSKRNSNNYYKNSKKGELNLFEFDPNTVTKEDLLKMGLKTWQADNLIKYREKGGVFKTSNDLSKVHGLDKELVQKLIPYIVISTEINTTSNGKNFDTILNLNTATEIELQKLQGIGPYYAKRIVEYRTILGGFLNVEQLMEVYGLTEELYQQIKDKFIISTENIKKININTAEYFDLVTHPYISKENAKNILNYRNFAGTIKSTEELLKQKAVDKEFYNKILPYISTE
jgi:competence ComEA-like helix-hairpin-helix protein